MPEITVDIMGAMLSLQRDLMYLRERIAKLERELAEYKSHRNADNAPWG